MPKSLQSRKQDLVRNAIYEAAISLFKQKGFDETTVEEVAQAAGVSRRSFFRYFPGKDDLLAHSIVSWGNVLASTVKTSTAESLIEVVQETVLAGATYSVMQPLTRQTIEISVRSPAAIRAQQSRLWEVENGIAEEFARRLGITAKYDMKPRLLAGLTVAATNAALLSWFNKEHRDISKSCAQVFATMENIICKSTSPGGIKHPMPVQRSARRAPIKKSG